MGRNKTMIELREKKVTVLICKEHKIREIIEVLRTNNKHKLWDKTKSQWTLSDWNDYFELKNQHEQIKKCIENDK